MSGCTDCIESNKGCHGKRVSGECVYYSGSFIAGPNISSGDTFNMTLNKIKTYVDMVAGGAAIITGQNVGTGAGWFKQKVGGNLQFRTILAGDNVVITPGIDEITVGVTGIVTNGANLSGSGTSIFVNKTGSTLNFRSVAVGTGLSVSESGGLITFVNTAPDQVVTLTAGANVTITGTYPNFGISASGGGGGGEVNTASNVGAGTGVFKQKLGVDLQFKTLTTGTGISITGNTNDVQITNTAPDQTVVLTAGTNVSITGTYPSFTINASGGGTVTGDLFS